MIVRAHVYVMGRVQGVCYRQSTRDRAAALGITGWVRNLGDGRVEAVFEGERSSVKEALAWCRRGPDGARVDGVDAAWDEAVEGIEGFTIRY
jgi:acylphosphatase